MPHKFIFLIVLLLHLSLNGETQSVSRLGIELGLVSSTSQEFTSIPGTFWPDVFAGYRYEKPAGRFFCRAGLSSLSLINIGGGLKF